MQMNISLFCLTYSISLLRFFTALKCCQLFAAGAPKYFWRPSLCPQISWLRLVIVRVNWLTIYLSNLYHVVITAMPGSWCLLNYCYEPSFSLLISDPCMNTRFAFLGADFYEQFKCNKLPAQPGPDTSSAHSIFHRSHRESSYSAR